MLEKKTKGQQETRMGGRAKGLTSWSKTNDVENSLLEWRKAGIRCPRKGL